MEILQQLHSLVDVFGAAGALAVVAWWYERRVNQDLQRRLMKLAAAQLQGAAEVRVALETIREILRHETRE